MSTNIVRRNYYIIQMSKNLRIFTIHSAHQLCFANKTEKSKHTKLIYSEINHFVS